MDPLERETSHEVNMAVMARDIKYIRDTMDGMSKEMKEFSASYV